MTSVLVWVLMSVSDGVYNRGNVTYSPPLKTLEDCQRLQNQLPKQSTYGSCVQINLVK